MLTIKMPDEAPAEKVDWKIVVNTTLRQGGITQHPFPFSIDDRLTDARDALLDDGSRGGH